jgi:hypothetical protein
MKKLAIGIMAFCFLAVVVGPALSEQSVDVVGIVSDNFEFENENGEVYILGDDDESLRLAENIGKKARVTGTLIDTDEGMVLTVKKFQLLEE